MSTKIEPPAALFEELDAATKHLREMEVAVMAWRSKETEASNRLNAAQKAVDAFIAEKRKESPKGSDWNKPNYKPGYI